MCPDSFPKTIKFIVSPEISITGKHWKFIAKHSSSQLLNSHQHFVLYGRPHSYHIWNAAVLVGASYTKTKGI